MFGQKMKKSFYKTIEPDPWRRDASTVRATGTQTMRKMLPPRANVARTVYALKFWQVDFSKVTSVVDMAPL